MQTLTEAIFKIAPLGGLFDQTVITNLFSNSSQGAKRLLINRAVGAGEIIRLKPGLFILEKDYRKSEIHPFAIASALHFPSHISLESALSFHGLIPEAVYQISSVTDKRCSEFTTPLGVFSFVRVPSSFGPAGVECLKIDADTWVFMATPLRAIADYVYLSRDVCWEKDGLNYLTESLRVEEDDIFQLSFDRFEEIHDSFRSRRVKQYLKEMKKVVAQ